jgi:LytS/YehU family sensor histidine kinase
MGRDAVPLAQEMTMVGHYLDIMKARLGDRLHCVVDPPAAHFHDLMLPPGLVLTLVENAIEHGVEPLLRGGGVKVRLQESSEALCIDVLDDGPGLPEPLREGVGLSNTRARLAQALGAQARLELCNRPAPDQGCWARIVIPMPGNAPSSAHSISHPNAHPVSS